MKFILVSLFTTCLFSQAFAQECGGSTVEMVGCMMEKAEKEQVGIDKSTVELKTILEVSKSYGDGEPVAYEVAKRTLDSANKTYDEFISLQCELEANLETMTGTLAKIVYAGCVADMKTKRNSYLKKLVKDNRIVK